VTGSGSTPPFASRLFGRRCLSGSSVATSCRKSLPSERSRS